MYTLESEQVSKQLEYEQTQLFNLSTEKPNLVPSPKSTVFEPSPAFLPETERAETQGTYDKLNQYFGEQDREQKMIQEARDLLRTGAVKLTDEQVLNLVSEVQFLVDSWLEEFERNIFEGKTLQEMFHLGKL